MKQTPDNVLNTRSPDTLKSLDALEKFTLPIIDYFTKALTHEDKWVRYLAAEALGSLGDLRAVEPLYQLQADKDADLRFEIAPAQMRGKLVSINQLTIVIGILLAQYINWFLVRNFPQGASDEFIRNSWFGQQGWRWMFGLTALPSLLFLIGMCFVAESPRWLAKNGQPDRARGVLQQIGGAPYADAAIAEIESTLASEEIQHVRFADLLEPKMRKVLVLGVVLAVFQQWCGINVIFN